MCSFFAQNTNSWAYYGARLTWITNGKSLNNCCSVIVLNNSCWLQ